MFKIGFWGLIFVAAGLVQAEDKSPMPSPHLQVPVLLPSEVVGLAENYLVHVKKSPEIDFALALWDIDISQ
jgi:hypothetical protein